MRLCGGSISVVVLVARCRLIRHSAGCCRRSALRLDRWWLQRVAMSAAVEAAGE